MLDGAAMRRTKEAMMTMQIGGAQQTAIIDAFRGSWEVIIMPLLTTHMTLTFLSYGLEKVAAGDGEDEYTKYNR